jgi:2-oxoglutarate ferredoxin oxidoreductase subunit alpha
VLLFPSTPKECFEMTADAFDLSEQLQTPVMVMTDLDLGMNDHVSPPLEWEDTRKYKRGKVLNEQELEKVERFARYMDVDGDGIPYRTYPGTHATKGAFFTRGTSRDEFATYTEDGDAYRRNMERLLKKWETAKTLVPTPEFYQEKYQHEYGILFFGTSKYAAEEAMYLLNQNELYVDALRVKAFPFNQTVEDFIAVHEKIFVIEQNRDAQLRSLLMIELGADPAKLIPVLNFDGTPITAANIVKQVSSHLIVAPQLNQAL